MSHGATVAAHTLRSGDGGGGGASVDVREKD
jgi:type IV secretion system protein TrbL